MKNNFRRALLIAGILSVFSIPSVMAAEHDIITTDTVMDTANYNGVTSTSPQYGGAIYVENANLTVNSGSFIGNSIEVEAPNVSYGGAIAANGGSVNIGSNVIFQNNTTKGEMDTVNWQGNAGGALALQNGSKSVIGDAVKFESNGGKENTMSGGAIYLSRNDLQIGNDAAFSSNSSAGQGGAIYSGDSNVTIGNGAVFENNESRTGGAIYNYGSTNDRTSNINIGDNATFSGNTASNNGGAAANYSGEFNVGSGAEFSGNTAGANGGAIHNVNYGKDSVVSIKGNTTFSGNSAGVSGGAIYNGDKLNMDTSAGDITFSGNTASGSKNDIYQTESSVTNITGNANKVSMDGGFAGQGEINKTGGNTLEFVNADNSKFEGTYTQDGGNLVLNNTDLFKNEAASVNIKNSTITLTGDNSDIVSANIGELNNSSLQNIDLNILNTSVITNELLNLTAGGIKSAVIEDTNYEGDITVNTNTSSSIISNDIESSYKGNLVNNGSVTINSNLDTTIKESNISGSGYIEKTGNGSLFVNNTETGGYNGVFVQTEGNAVFNNSNLFQNSELKTGTVTTIEGTGNFNENSQIVANGTLNVNAEAALKNSNITGNGIFNSSNSLNLDNSNIYQDKFTSTSDVTLTNNSGLTANDITANLIDATASEITAGNNLNVNTDLKADSTSIVVNGATTVNGKTDLQNNSTLSMNGNGKFNDLNIGSGSVLQFLNPDSTFEVENGFKINNGTVNVMNNQLTNNIINSDMTIDERAAFTVDVDPRNFKSDIFTINGNIQNAGGASAPDAHITISDFNLTSVPVNRYIDLPELFNFNGNVDANIQFMDSEVQKFTPIGWYQMQRNAGNDGYRLGLTAYNNQVYRGQVATVASYANQLVTNNIILDHIYLTSQNLMAEEKSNKYAAAYPQFAPYQYNKDTGSLWVKTYVNFERLGLTQGLNVGNNAYGTIVGADFPVVNMKDGWKFLPTAFVGYNGAHQTFDSVGMYQNGGQAGFMGTFMKNDFIGSAMVYGGGYNNEMNVANLTSFGSEGSYTDHTGNWFVGVAAKTAYNFHPTKHFIIQPTLLASYNLFGQQNWHTNYGDMSMRSNYLNGINVAPGVNFIYARETWSLYLTAQYVYNIMGYAAGMAGRDVDLPHIRMRHGYIEYGVGATKTIKDRLHSYVQITMRNGGRTGVGFQLGLSWLF